MKQLELALEATEEVKSLRDRLNYRDNVLMWAIIGYRKDGDDEQVDKAYAERVKVWASLDKLDKGYEPFDVEWQHLDGLISLRKKRL
jgi:hypothetical protein